MLWIKTKFLFVLNRFFTIFSIAFLLFSCGSESVKNKDNDENTKPSAKDTLLKPSHIDEGNTMIIAPEVEKDETPVTLAQNGITLTAISNNPEKTVSLSLNTETFSEGENEFLFSVSGIDNYHLFVFLNGALYQVQNNKLTIDLLDGNNLIACFLTDENYTIVKQPSAIILKNIIIGKHDDYFNEKQPHLLYFSPNEFSTNLDFLLVNTNLEKHGFKVKATIDNTGFIIEKWYAYVISGIKKGEHSVRLQLLDENGQLIEGPFNDSGVHLFRID